MGKISEIFNFDDIGGKIKGLAKGSCWSTILLLWIATPILIIVAISEGGDDALVAVILFPIAAVIASFAIWVGSWAMYAFGELVEDVHAMRNKEETVAEEKTKHGTEKTNNLRNNSNVPQEVKKQIKDDVFIDVKKSTNTPQTISTHKWRCDGCEKMRTQTPCEHCGKE